MKIMVMNDFLLAGGAEIYTKNLINILLNENHEVRLITFDNDYNSKISNYDVNNVIIENINHSKVDKIRFNKKMHSKLKQYIDDFSPDKIIVNNLFASPFTQYRALEGYDAYQVVHDYHFICPKSTCIKSNYEVCSGYKEKCLKNCKYHNSKILLEIKKIQTKKLENIRKKYIKKFISPSECLKKYLDNYGYNSVCINNPINMNNLNENFNKKKLTDTRKITYVGMINEKKGIFKFLEVFRQYKNFNNIEIEIIGKCSTIKDQEKLESLLNSNIRYLGSKSNLEVIKMLHESQFMIVPSLWMENYPTTVLEGMLTGNLILGSNRGGIPNMISENRGLQFSILDKSSIFKLLDMVAVMTQDEYIKIINNTYEYTIKNNSYEKYYQRIIKILK